jgi:hypothetical protein
MWIFNARHVLRRDRGNRCTEMAAGKNGASSPKGCPLAEGNWPLGDADWGRKRRIFRAQARDVL